MRVPSLCGVGKTVMAYRWHNGNIVTFRPDERAAASFAGGTWTLKGDILCIEWNTLMPEKHIVKEGGAGLVSEDGQYTHTLQ